MSNSSAYCGSIWSNSTITTRFGFSGVDFAASDVVAPATMKVVARAAAASAAKARGRRIGVSFKRNDGDPGGTTSEICS